MKCLAIAVALLIAIGLTEYRQREFAKPLRLTPGSRANPYDLSHVDMHFRCKTGEWGIKNGVVYECLHQEEQDIWMLKLGPVYKWPKD